MDDFIGKWIAGYDDNYDAFLQYIGYNRMNRFLACQVKIKLHITRVKEGWLRRAYCRFVSSDEVYKIDNRFRKSEDGVEKRHRLEAGYLHTDVLCCTGNWSERVHVDGNELILRRQWTDQQGMMQESLQIFNRRNNKTLKSDDTDDWVVM